MYDLHTHSLLSDGCLLPSELARRYEKKGYKAIAITDHVDIANIKRVVSEIVNFCQNWPKNRIKVLPGIELTHIPPEQFTKLTKYARKHGIKVIVAHGESPIEPVIKGTNKAALRSDIDILAHPGKLAKEDALLAKKKGIFLEITLRKGHKLTNRHVAKIAKSVGAFLTFNSDSHKPEDIPELAKFRSLAREIGLNDSGLKEIRNRLKNKFQI
ncbi:MAG: histidinol phosphate phosphatase domain-containing protein [Candidatus Omnitrophica bacterium]|nr:histidinol phosphate phosphatase domain-containing protein [Candidatus Omnitrophota bacterium]